MKNMLYIVFQTLCILFVSGFGHLHATTNPGFSSESAIHANVFSEKNSDSAHKISAAFFQEPSTGSGHRLFLGIAEIENVEEEDLSTSKEFLGGAGYFEAITPSDFCFYNSESITHCLPYCKHFSYLAQDRYLKILVIRI